MNSFAIVCPVTQGACYHAAASAKAVWSHLRPNADEIGSCYRRDVHADAVDAGQEASELAVIVAQFEID